MARAMAQPRPSATTASVNTLSSEPSTPRKPASRQPGDVRHDEDSPLPRKASLRNKPERPKRKAPDSDHIEYHKKWRSPENAADAKGSAKTPRLAIHLRLPGTLGGGARSTTSPLRRAPHPLDCESAARAAQAAAQCPPVEQVYARQEGARQRPAAHVLPGVHAPSSAP